MIDKPQEFTSFDVVAVVRKCTGIKKIGHTGTLDPMATGVLPLLIGRATKAADIISDSDKEYEALFKIGIKTDTGDITGKVTESSQNTAEKAELIQAAKNFVGDIMQTPPMYSAVSVNGQRLYKLARKGIEIEREKRSVCIRKLELDFDEDTQTGRLTIACSKGTYIRTLIEDIAESVGCLAVMTALRRTKASGFCLEEAVTLEKLKACQGREEIEGMLKPIDILFEDLPDLTISEAQGNRFKNGGALGLERLRYSGEFRDKIKMRVYSPDKEFIGIGEIDISKGEMKVFKLFSLR